MRLAVLLALVLGACTPVPARQATALKPAIVSLNPCTDAILAEVADPAQVLALSHYSRDSSSSSMDLSLARRFRATSGTVEEILALRPDVVIAGTFLPPATKNALARFGIRLVELPIAPTVEASRQQVAHIAALAGQPQRGRALDARITAALAKAAPSTGTPRTAIVWQSGGIVAGGETLIADLLARTGFVNAAAARGLRQADHLPLERMIADPPEVIFAAGTPGAEEDRLLSHPALAKLSATRREPLDSALLWCGGPTIPRAVERLAQVRRSL